MHVRHMIVGYREHTPLVEIQGCVHEVEFIEGWTLGNTPWRRIRTRRARIPNLGLFLIQFSVNDNANLVEPAEWFEEWSLHQIV